MSVSTPKSLRHPASQCVTSCSGEAGTGKTMGAQAIAAGLNLPYTLMTCSANTEITDLVGQFIPDTGNFQSDFNCTELPKISDITMHPPSVYMMLTGEYDEEKTEDDVLQKLIEIAVGNLVEKEETPASASAMWIHLSLRRSGTAMFVNCRSLPVSQTTSVLVGELSAG